MLVTGDVADGANSDAGVEGGGPAAGNMSTTIEVGAVPGCRYLLSVASPRADQARSVGFVDPTKLVGSRCDMLGLSDAGMVRDRM
jgi:hypothetical protein